MDRIALIVAGGSGKRMNAGIPKQFMLLGEIPVLMHTLNIFRSFDHEMRIILALPENLIEAWRKLCRLYGFTLSHEICAGGESRFHTVKNSLKIIPDQCLVAIHDGVRPLVSHDTIQRCFDTAMQYGNAVPCIEIPETMRRITTKGSKQVNRSQYRLIQTPQVFESTLLKKAYGQKYRSHFTDDAGVVESLDTIHLVEGNPENIKITFKKDLLIAASLLTRE